MGWDRMGWDRDRDKDKDRMGWMGWDGMGGRGKGKGLGAIPTDKMGGSEMSSGSITVL